MQNEEHPIDEYDREFISLVMDIEKRCESLSKHDKLRVESWCKKLCQVTNNIEWKKNRNLHAICLLDMMLNKRFEDPYNKFAPEGSIQILSKTIVKSRLSQKFWKNSEKVYGNNQQKDGHQDIQQYEDNNINNNEEEFVNHEPRSNQKNKLAQSKQGSNSPIVGSSELDKLKDTIELLKNDLEKKDRVIRNQKDEKTKLTRRVDELERMLASFLVISK